MGFSFSPATLYGVTIGLCVLAYTMWQVVLPLSFIHSSICPYLLSMAIFQIFNPLTFILTSGLRTMIPRATFSQCFVSEHLSEDQLTFIRVLCETILQATQFIMLQSLYYHLLVLDNLIILHVLIYLKRGSMFEILLRLISIKSCFSQNVLALIAETLDNTELMLVRETAIPSSIR